MITIARLTIREAARRQILWVLLALTIVSVGSCTINADQAGNGSYLPASQVSHTFNVVGVAPDAPVPRTAELILAFDYGLRRIGVAVGNTGTRTATAIGALVARGVPDWPARRARRSSRSGSACHRS